MKQVDYRGRALLGGAKVNVTKGTWTVLSTRENGDVCLQRRPAGLEITVKAKDWRRRVKTGVVA